MNVLHNKLYKKKPTGWLGNDNVYIWGGKPQVGKTRGIGRD